MCGCSGKNQQVLKDNNKVLVKSIAVLPVENKNSDDKASELFRSRMVEELYFKGYSKLSPDMIDKKLETLRAGEEKNVATDVTPKVLRELMGADAGMYCTLTRETKSKIFYTPIKISVKCELHSAENGEVLWSGQSESTEASFDLTKKGLEKKSHEYLEILIEEVVNKITKTLPDGPNLRG